MAQPDDPSRESATPDSTRGPDTDGEYEGWDDASPAYISNPQLRLEMHKAMVWVGVIGLAALAVYISQSLLVIFAALVFASMIDGGARLIGRYLPIPRTLRIVMVLLLAIAFLVWLGYFAGSQIAEQAATLPAIVEKQLNEIIALAQQNGMQVSLSDAQSMANQVVSGVGTVTRAIGGIAGIIGTTAIILIIGIYVALEPNLYERGVEWMAPRGERSELRKTLAEMALTLRRLMAGRIVGMVFEGFFTWVALEMFGVPMAALLGILTGLLAFIPNIGAVVSGLLMATVGFSVSVETGLAAVAIYFVVQTFDGYVVIPMIARKTVDLPPALVLGAQLIMGLLFGIIGLLLADPLLAMLKVALVRRSEANQAAQDSEYAAAAAAAASRADA
ncbi:MULTISPECIES: AI-2E family transporter [Sphingomonadales]|jgi:putative permease|uniref:AI-2E family transporter n=1 Tax=Sphingomonadales TaxID=204457 RepID=UPI0001DD10B6|nr:MULTISPECIES: AI-2E family transporter [Sphingomonadales]MAY77769.1 AI-2E family transporter [Citromicrobium sp.]|tara:strand:+ start:2942 stop:4108 length:1167 start_codon:yes stop_codon:yes gene_type:complete